MHIEIDAIVDASKDAGDKDRVFATIPHRDRDTEEFRFSDMSAMDELDKFIEDVR